MHATSAIDAICMVLTRSQRRSTPFCDTETIPDDEFWAVDAAIRAAEEAFDAVPLLAPVLMPVVPGSVAVAPGLAARSAVTPAGWLPAPELRLPPVLDARRLQPPRQAAPQSAAHSPQRRLSAPAALDSAAPAKRPPSVTPARRLSRTAPHTMRSPAIRDLKSSPPAAAQSTMLRFLTPHSSTGATRTARARARLGRRSRVWRRRRRG